MKVLIGVLLCLSFYSQIAKAQTPAWQWAIQSTGPSSGAAFARSLCVDRKGDIYVLVNFNDSIQLGDSIYYSASRISSLGGGSFGLLLIKYNSERKILWIVNPQGIVTWRDGIISLDSAGNCYLAAEAATKMDFGNNIKIDFGDSVKIGQGTFIVKYDPDGYALWVIKAVPLEQFFEVNAIATDINNNIFIIGGAYNSDSASTLLAKYNSDGVLLWQTKPIITNHKQNLTGGAHVEPFGLSVVNEAENQVIYTSGQMYSDTIFYGNNFISGIGVNLPSNQAFLAKLNAEGNCEWIKSIDLHRQFYAQGNSFSVCANGQYAYVCGNFGIDSSRRNDSSSTYFGNTYSFIAQYDRSGSLQWIRSLFSQTRVIAYQWDISCNDISVDDENNSYLSGIFIGDTEFSDTLIHSPGLDFAQQYNQFPQDVFAVTFDKNGNRRWIQLSERTTLGTVSIACHEALFGENLYLAGGFMESVDFGNTHLIRNDSGANEPTYFLAKLGITPSAVKTNPKSNDNNFSLFPNPASSQATLNFTLDKSSNITIEIFDLLGRLVKEISLGEMNSGVHSENLNLQRLINGAYIYRLTAGGNIASAPFSVIK